MLNNLKEKINILRFLFRIVISVLLLLLLIRAIDMTQLGHLISRARWSYLIGACFVLIIERILMIFRWIILLDTKKIKVPIIRIIKIYFLSSFVGMFLPSSVAIDTVRAYSLSKYTLNPTESISSIVVDRMMGMIALLCFALFGVIFFYGEFVSRNLFLFVLFMVLIFIVAIWAFQNKMVRIRVSKFLQRGDSNIIFDTVHKLYHSITDYKVHRNSILVLLILALIVQGLRIFLAYYIALSLSLNYLIIYFIIFIPLIGIVNLIPISVGGIGVQEGAFMYFFSQIGMSNSEAFTLSVLLHILIIIFVLPGGIIYMIEGISVRPQTA